MWGSEAICRGKRAERARDLLCVGRSVRLRLDLQLLHDVRLKLLRRVELNVPPELTFPAARRVFQAHAAFFHRLGDTLDGNGRVRTGLGCRHRVRAAATTSVATHPSGTLSMFRAAMHVFRVSTVPTGAHPSHLFTVHASMNAVPWVTFPSGCATLVARFIIRDRAFNIVVREAGYRMWECV